MRLVACAPVALLLLALTACSESSVPPPAASSPTPSVPAAVSKAAVGSPADAALARYDGYGDLRFGMDVATFRTAWQGRLVVAMDVAAGCSYLRPIGVKQPRDFGFMFAQGHFVRYDVSTAREIAPGGGKVGMDAAGLRALYGEALQASPHKYVEGAQLLRVAAPDGNGALVFETDAHGTVATWRAGVPPQIDYLEGCG